MADKKAHPYTLYHRWFGFLSIHEQDADWLGSLFEGVAGIDKIESMYKVI